MDSNRERQAAELVLLQSMYADEFSWQTTPLDPSEDINNDEPDPKVSIRIDELFTLDITLPESYPVAAKPVAYLHCAGNVDTATRKHARTAVENVLQGLDSGTEILDVLVMGAIEALQPVIASVHHSDDDHSSTETDGGDHGGDQSTNLRTGHEGKSSQSNSAGRKSDNSRTYKRLLLWSHHLLSTQKRKDIVAWSRELGLKGYSRPGHPGAIFIEGLASDVDEFVRRMKALRWQALQVRLEEVGDQSLLDGHHTQSGPVGAGHQVHAEGVHEVEGLGDIAEGLRSSSKDGERLATLFLEGMKITGAGPATHKS